MPRFVVEAVLKTADAERDAAGFFDRLKARGIDAQKEINKAVNAAGGSKSGAADKATDQVADGARKAAKELLELQARAKAAGSQIAQIGVEIKTTQGIETIKKDLILIRQEAIAYEAAAKQALDPAGVKAYATVVTQATAALEKLSKASSSLAGGKTLEFGGDNFIKSVRAASTAFDDLERGRRVGTKALQAYRQELLAIQSVAQQKAGNTSLGAAERAAYAGVDRKAQGLINKGDSVEAKKLEQAITRVNKLLMDQSINSQQAGTALANLSARAGQLATSQNVSNEAAERYLRTQQKINSASSNLAGGDQGVVKAREAAAAQKVLTDQYGAGLTVTRQGETATEAYQRQLTSLAAAARTGATNTNLSTAAQKEYTKAAAAAATALERLKRQQASGRGDNSDRDLTYARALGEAQQQLATKYRAGTLARRDGESSAQSFRRQLEALVGVARAESEATNRSTASRREFTRTAAAAADALKRLRAEQNSLSSGGSAAFALNSVAFGFGGASALGGKFLTDALELNEKAKMAAINLSATAKYYNFSSDEMAASVKKLSGEIRVSETDVSTATSFLVKAGFDAKSAFDTIKLASDSGVANAINASKAIAAIAQGVQQGRSILLNTGGVEENIGPEIQAIERAIKKGEDYTRNVYLQVDAAREFYDRQRANGVAFREAADAAGRYQFIIKATRVDAGRTAETLNSLTGSLGNFKTQAELAKIGLLEGVGRVAIPVVNIGADALKFFDGLPAAVKNTAGVALALTGAAGASIAFGAGLLAVSLQTRKVITESMILTPLTNALASAKARAAAAGAGLNTTLTFQNVALAGNAARTGVATVATNVYAASVVRLNTALGFLKANPIILVGTGAVAGALALAKGYQEVADTYDQIAASDKAFNEKIIAQNGEEFAEKLNKLMILAEVKDGFQKQLENATTPEETAAAQQRLKNVDERISGLRGELREIRAVNEANKGSANATIEQAEAYRLLKEQLDAVADRYGDMKLTTFQKDLRALAKEQERQIVAIDKGEREYVSSEKQSGLTPEAAAKLRAQAASLVPQGIAGLVNREIEEARKSAVAARLEMEKQQNELVKDGVAKRKTTLKLETREIQEEYAERLKIVRANKADSSLDPFEQGLTEEQKVVRISQLQEFNQIEGDLVAERDARIKLLATKASADLKEIYRERQRALEDIIRAGTEAQIRQLAALKGQMESARTGTLNSAGTDAARLSVEQGFAVKALDLTRRTSQLQAKLQRQEAQRAYQDALEQAKTLGEKRAQAEGAARTNLNQTLQTIDLEAANTVTEARIAGEERVGAARTKLVQSALDLELANIGKIEGAQLLALRGRYAREQALARRRGDISGADAYEGAIKNIDAEGLTRIATVTDLITKGREAAEGLGQELVNLNGKAAKGLEAAQIAAASPFDAFIKARQKEQSDLVKAREKLITTDPGLASSIDAEIAKLNTYIQQATAGRIGAVQRAGTNFTLAARDKAVKAAAETASKLYDSGEGDAAAYQSALKSEETYWKARLLGLDKGAEDYETQLDTIRGRVEEIRQAQSDAAARLAAKPLESAKSDLALNEAKSGVARTDAERNRLLAERLVLLGRVSALETKNAQDSTLTANQQREAAIQSLNTQGAALGIQKQIDEAASANVKSLADLAAAQVEYTVAIASSDVAITAAIADRLELTRKQITAQDGVIAKAKDRGESEATINALQVDRLKLLGQEVAQERELADRPMKLLEERLGREKDLRQAKLDTSAAAGDEVAQAALNLDLAERGLDIARQRLALARSQGNDAATGAAEVAAAQAQVTLLRSRNALLQAPIQARQRENSLLTAQKALQAAIAGDADDVVVQANLKVQAAERDLAVADELVASAATRLELEAALLRQAETRIAVVSAESELQKAIIARTTGQEGRVTEMANAQAQFAAAQKQFAKAQQDYAAAELKAARDTLEASLKRASVEAILRDTVSDKVKAAEAELAANRARLTQMQGQSLDGLSPGDQAAALNERIDMIGQVVIGERQVAQARVEAETNLLDIMDARQKAARRILGTADDGIVAAREDLDLARQRLALTRQQLERGGLGRDERSALLGNQVDLLAQVAEGERKLADVQKAAAVLARELTISEAGFRLELAGGTAETRAAAEAALALMAARSGVSQATTGLADARASGDPTKIKAATDELTSSLAAQRGAVSKLAETYSGLLSSMGAVQSASADLQKAVYGEAGQPFDQSREISRLVAIEQRRNQAIGQLQQALRNGDKAAIASAAQALATQEKRYRDQATLLEKNGVEVQRTGQGITESLAGQVDRLSIEYDRESVVAQTRLDAARQEAQAALTFAAAVAQFGATTAGLLTQLGRAPSSLGDPAPTAAQQAQLAELNAATQARVTPPDASVADAVLKGLRDASDQLGFAIQGVLAEAREALEEARVAFSNAQKQFGQSMQSSRPQTSSRRFADTPAPAAKLAPNTGRQIAAAVAAGIQQPLAAQSQSMAAYAASVGKLDGVQASKTIYNNWSAPVTVYAAAGQDAESIANVVIDRLERQSDLLGGQC